MNHNLETVKLKLRAYNTHRGRLEDVFKELEGFEKELIAKIKDARKNQRIWLKRYKESNEKWHNEASEQWGVIAFALEEILGKKESAHDV